MSTTSIFVQIDDGRVVTGSATSQGAKGDATAAEDAESYEEWILADAVKLDLSREGPAGAGSSGGSAGGTSGGSAAPGASAAAGGASTASTLRAQATPITITKQLDLASCGLIRLVQAKEGEEEVAVVKIDICAPTGMDGKFQWYMRYMLETCTVISYSIEMSHSEKPVETVVIHYEKLVTRFRVWGEDNKPTRDAPPQSYNFTEQHDAPT